MVLKINEKHRVQFCDSIGHSLLETKTLLEKSFGKDAMKRISVYSWYKRFHEGRETVRDDPRPGQPSVTDSKVTLVKEMLDSDRRVTIKEIADAYDLSVGSAHKIVTKRVV